MATISRLLKIIGLVCRISSLFQGFFAKETYHLKEPTNRSHPITHNRNSLQQTATRCDEHCNTLQHTATHCNTLQHTAAHCSTLQHTATHCNTLQHTAAHCSTLQHTAAHSYTHNRDAAPRTARLELFCFSRKQMVGTKMREF